MRDSPRERSKMVIKMRCRQSEDLHFELTTHDDSNIWSSRMTSFITELEVGAVEERIFSVREEGCGDFGCSQRGFRHRGKVGKMNKHNRDKDIFGCWHLKDHSGRFTIARSLEP